MKHLKIMLCVFFISKERIVGGGLRTLYNNARAMKICPEATAGIVGAKVYGDDVRRGTYF